MKKFICVFICFLFSFFLFVQDVYASVGSSYSVNLVVDHTSNSYNFLDAFVGYAPIGSNSSVRSYSYDFIDHLTLRWKGTDGSVIPNGYYTFSCRLVYSFTADFTLSTDFLLNYPTFYFHNLPSGFDCQILSFKKVDDHYELTFDLRGNAYFSNARSSSFDLFFSFVTESALTNSTNIVPSIKFSPVITVSSYSSRITLTSVAESSDNLIQDVTSAVGAVNDTIKKEHQEEIDKANETSKDITSSSGKLEATLSAWEIFTMPFQLVKDFAQAISSDGNTGFTFPSFSMMGYEIWPSYTFDLSTVKTNFPVLYNGLHLVSGTIVVSGFIHYCWRKWSILMGDDLPESSSGEGG